MQDILDLEEYPLDLPGSARWTALVEQCRRDLEAEGMFNLIGLMHQDVAGQVAKDLGPRIETEAFLHEREHNIYFRKSLPELPEDHPALTRFRTSNFTLCGDQLRDTPMARLYHWPEFAQFLAATMAMPSLFPMDDEMAGLNVMSYRSGQALNWHFDRSEFTTTLLLQSPVRGGEFVYRTNLRSDQDPNYDGVGRLLVGADPDVQSLTLSPGTLNVFRGKNTPHRVSAVEGTKPRVISVFSFFREPGVTFSDAERIGFYGRAH